MLNDCNEVEELFLPFSSADSFDRDGFRGRMRTLFDERPGLELVEGDLDVDFLGKGKASSGVWLNLFTKSFNDVWRLRAVLERVGLDFAALNGDLSEVGELW